MARAVSDGKSRQWNIANNNVYIKSLSEDKLAFEREELDERTRFNEYLMTGLRTRKGIDLVHIQSTFGFDLQKTYRDMIDELSHSNKLVVKNNQLSLTDEGLLMADRIASDFFIVEE